MRRASVRRWGLLAALLFALALVACLLLWNAPGGEWVAVERDGEELFRFRPADIEGAQTFDVPCEGGYNTIAVENGEGARRGGGLPRPDLREDGRAALPRLAHRLPAAPPDYPLCGRRGGRRTGRGGAMKGGGGGMDARRLTRLALLTAVALSLFVVELQLPDQ